MRSPFSTPSAAAPGEAELLALVRSHPPPAHVAIIMDGNGRWATQRGLPRVAGHREGVTAARGIVRAAGELGIRYLTLYAFSTENWRRPRAEVSTLMGLLERSINAELPRLMEQDVRLRVAMSHTDRSAAQRLVREVTALYTCGPAGGGGVRTALRARLGTVSCTVPRNQVPAKFRFWSAAGDGK